MLWSFGDAYVRWLTTQNLTPRCEYDDAGSYLHAIKALHAERAPGRTCIEALRDKAHRGDLATNNSKGCGGIMRVAPVGLYYAAKQLRRPAVADCFDTAVMTAALTHGHPTGQLAAGAFAVIVERLASGMTLAGAIRGAEAELAKRAGHEETLKALRAARALAGGEAKPSPALVETLGKGWVAEEALAISVYCALVADDFAHGVRLAVNHSGDSDSTGSMTGQMLGALLGEAAIPARWAGSVELGWLVLELASDLADCAAWHFDGEHRSAIWSKYPGY